MLNAYADILIKEGLGVPDLVERLDAIRLECRRLGELCVSRFGTEESSEESASSEARRVEAA